MKKSNYVNALLWVPAVVGSFYLETFWYAKIRYIREVSFFDYRLTLIAVSMLIFTISMLLIYKIQERESKKNMSKEKQIEEMADVYYKARLKARDTLGSMNEGAEMWYAKAFYEAGYRKQSEGEWIDANPDGHVYRFTCSLCGKTKLGRGTPYCPNCGAKMKGG